MCVFVRLAVEKAINLVFLAYFSAFYCLTQLKKIVIKTKDHRIIRIGNIS